MAIDWKAFGEDFEQKYSGSFVRYLSPLSKRKDIFVIVEVGISDRRPPDLTLFSDRHGEIYLNYNGEADLDFTFPQVGNFQHKERCLRFDKKHERQWRKGVCGNTARVSFAYNTLYPAFHLGLNEETLESAYKDFIPCTIADAVKKIQADELFSVALSPTLSLGPGEKENVYWLWFDDEVIGTVIDGQVKIQNSLFQQEVSDFIRDMRDNVRIAV